MNTFLEWLDRMRALLLENAISMVFLLYFDFLYAIMFPIVIKHEFYHMEINKN